MKKILILAFPGNNCEIETARAVAKAGFDAEIVRWNEDPKKIVSADGLVIPGGFSFEDRGRSGVVAAKNAVADIVRTMAAEGKPVLGICNGAQILVEMGLVPGFHPGKVEMSLARNRRVKNGKILGSGFFHDFVFLKKSGECAFTHFEKILKMPIAHGEGRFVASEEVQKAICENRQIVLKYCDQEGNVHSDFPTNPNGSFENAAAICNPTGNVMAIMPHPERAPEGSAVFDSLRDFFTGKTKKPKVSNIPSAIPSVSLEQKPEFSLEIFVRLKITDTTEATMEKVAQDLLGRKNLRLVRRVWWGIETTENPLEMAKKLIASDEFLNEAKESAIVKIGDEYFSVAEKTLEKIENFTPLRGLFSTETDDILGEEKSEILEKHSNIKVSVTSGIFWEMSETVPAEEIAATNLFANPVSGKILFSSKD